MKFRDKANGFIRRDNRPHLFHVKYRIIQNLLRIQEKLQVHMGENLNYTI